MDYELNRLFAQTPEGREAQAIIARLRYRNETLQRLYELEAAQTDCLIARNAALTAALERSGGIAPPV